MPLLIDGIIIDEYTTVERDALVLPASRLMIYNSTDSQYQVNDGTPSVPVWTASSNLTTADVPASTDANYVTDNQLEHLEVGGGNLVDQTINIVDNTATPPTEVSGDIYILDATGATNAAWDGALAWDIVKFNGTTWDSYTPKEGYRSYIETLGVYYRFDGSTWINDTPDADDIDDTSTTNKFVTAGDTTNLGNLSGINTGDEVQATTTVKGIAETATQTEVNTGTDTQRIVTPDTLEDKTYGTFTGDIITDNSVLKTALQELETAIEAITEGLETKSGAALVGAFTGNPKVATITFATAYADTDYSINITPVMTDGTKNFVVTSFDKVAGGFKISLNSNSIVDLISVDWSATKYGES